EGAATYQKRLADFQARVDAAEKSWQPLIAKVHGDKVVTYHQSWSYVSSWLGLKEIGYLEPKPGIPPDPQHLLRLIQAMRAAKVKVLMVAGSYDQNTEQLLVRQGVRTVVRVTMSVSR